MLTVTVGNVTQLVHKYWMEWDSFIHALMTMYSNDFHDPLTFHFIVSHTSVCAHIAAKLDISISLSCTLCLVLNSNSYRAQMSENHTC